MNFVPKSASTPGDLFVRGATFSMTGTKTASHDLTSLELQALSKAFGYMPQLVEVPNARPPMQLIEERVEELDANLRREAQGLCDRFQERNDRESSYRRCLRAACASVWSCLKLGVVKEIYFEVCAYFIYSLALQYYSYHHNWEAQWSAAGQDTVYYPALVMAFLLSFRASSCMDRYSAGRDCIFQMQKHLRDVAFRVLSHLAGEGDEQTPTARGIGTTALKQRYFQHEFRRLTRLLFVCAARDLSDSAADEEDVLEHAASRLQCAMTYAEQSVVHVTHSRHGHVLRVHIAALWLLNLVRDASDQGLFDSSDVYKESEQVIDGFKDAWLKARNIAYSEMPNSMIHLLRVLAHALNLALPWEYVTVCQWMTWLPSLFMTVSFFGIVKIANNLENPFGFDDDDIPVWDIAKDLDDEIALMMFYSALDEVGGENLYRGLASLDHIHA